MHAEVDNNDNDVTHMHESPKQKKSIATHRKIISDTT